MKIITLFCLLVCGVSLRGEVPRSAAGIAEPQTTQDPMSGFPPNDGDLYPGGACAGISETALAFDQLLGRGRVDKRCSPVPLETLAQQIVLYCNGQAPQLRLPQWVSFKNGKVLSLLDARADLAMEVQWTAQRIARQDIPKFYVDAFRDARAFQASLRDGTAKLLIVGMLEPAGSGGDQKKEVYTRFHQIIVKKFVDKEAGHAEVDATSKIWVWDPNTTYWGWQVGRLAPAASDGYLSLSYLQLDGFGNPYIVRWDRLKFRDVRPLRAPRENVTPAPRKEGREVPGEGKGDRKPD